MCGMRTIFLLVYDISHFVCLFYVTILQYRFSFCTAVRHVLSLNEKSTLLLDAPINNIILKLKTKHIKTTNSVSINHFYYIRVFTKINT